MRESLLCFVAGFSDVVHVKSTYALQSLAVNL